MSTNALFLVEGGRPNGHAEHWHGGVEQSVDCAIRAGFRIGRRVRIGRIPGAVVGYNISRFGRFCGASYPLLVETEFGVAKCSLHEVAAA
ncbi:hypothetical protein [Thauera sinica]|uniref:Uncharacterized protein n=1 Tax=Thauera sinica TaxID=2665146 RepID=A0ABW1AW41_9RHOO|nr:hypothetical protein [Thauera sp. K11]ATE62581.1 hypothetical protein CCZ27_10040 [Thauera sp. K11]